MTAQWKIRFVITLLILLLSLVSLILLKVNIVWYWHFSWAMAVLDGLFCLGLIWYLQRSAFGQQIFHWLGLFLALGLLSLGVSKGLISPLAGGVFTLILLAFLFYLTGLYIDFNFLLIGLALALLAAGAILIKTYWLFILVCLIIVITMGSLFIVKRDPNRQVLKR